MFKVLQKNITITGTSIIDGVEVEGYQATINSDKPEDIAFSYWPKNASMKKEKRVQCREDRATFEDMAYQIQDEMLEENKANTEE